MFYLLYSSNMNNENTSITTLTGQGRLLLSRYSLSPLPERERKMKQTKYNMVLKHVPNIDINYRGGYWQTVEDGKNIVIKADKLSTMRNEFVDWIKRNGLGSGNVPMIDVYANDKQIGYFSYNARFWRGIYKKESGG